MKEYKIAVLEGDGIGPEVMSEALKVLFEVAELEGFTLNFENGLIGGAAIDACGTALPDETVDLALRSDAVLLGSVGGPKWDKLPPQERPELGGLLAIRKKLNLFANLRPVKLYPGLDELCPIKPGGKTPAIDLLTVRELSGGIYFGQPKELTENEGLDTMIYDRKTVTQIMHEAFKIARLRSKKVCSVDKANVLRSSILWREVAEEVSNEYSDVELSHMYVDNAAMQLILNPAQFDVIVTGNLFGDILSDESAALAGSLGMLPSASLGDKVHLFEPSGGSAPDIAGKGIANPLAQILSAAMMLEYSLGEIAGAKRISQAVEKALADGFRTGDIAGSEDKVVGTQEMGEAVRQRL
jgi:3-isopropylmalate dehydrogenase